MAQDKSEPTQFTPKGLEIPVPTWADVMRDLAKASEPEKPGGESEPPSERQRRPDE
jgi:hypothetical protein